MNQEKDNSEEEQPRFWGTWEQEGLGVQELIQAKPGLTLLYEI